MSESSQEKYTNQTILQRFMSKLKLDKEDNQVNYVPRLGILVIIFIR